MTDEIQMLPPTPIAARDDLPSWFGQTVAFGSRVLDEVRLTVAGDTLFVVGDCEGRLAISVTLPVEYLDQVKERLEEGRYEHLRTKWVESFDLGGNWDGYSELPRVPCEVYTQPDRYSRQLKEAYLFAAAHADKLAELLADDRRYDRARGAATWVRGDVELHPWGLVARIYREIDIAAADSNEIDLRRIVSSLWAEADVYIRAGRKIYDVAENVYELWQSKQSPTNGSEVKEKRKLSPREAQKEFWLAYRPTPHRPRG